MGCAGSTPAKVEKADQPIWNKQPSQAHINVERKRKNSIERMSETTADALRDMFSEYRRQSRASAAEDDDEEEEADAAGGEADADARLAEEKRKRKRKMDRDGLRKILTGHVNEELFGFIWRLFDPKGRGFVDADEFVMAVALLTNEMQTLEDQVNAAFVMFDEDKDGALSKDEFETMISVTVNLSLDHLLDTSTGLQTFEAQLQKEYSEENLDFWRAAVSRAPARALRSPGPSLPLLTYAHTLSPAARVPGS
jgi:Ca2+-binding EF-hand superfamily protein